jgi:hypothetical protein
MPHVRVVVVVAITLGLLCSSSPLQVRADSRGAPHETLRLVSDSQPRPVAELNKNDSPENESKRGTSRELPSLRDLGLNLDSSEVVKRNELDSLTVEPWTPGRGAVGVKVEITW